MPPNEQKLPLPQSADEDEYVLKMPVKCVPPVLRLRRRLRCKTATYKSPAYKTPVYESPSDKSPACETPAYKTPAYESPSGMSSACETLSYKALMYGTATYETPADEIPGDLVSEDETSAYNKKAPGDYQIIPSTPLNTPLKLCREPRPGEILFSLSGSPIKMPPVSNT